MPKLYEKTSMGGSKETFQTTLWTEIEQVKNLEKEQQKIIIGILMEKYWKPVYCYLRRKGYNNEHAKDLTQGFFHEIVLGKNLFRQADKSKGRFRTFLLTTLDRYVTSMHRKATAKKRAPSGTMLQFDSFDLPDYSTEQSKMNPQYVFDFAWAANILDETLTKLKEEYIQTNRESYWNVFSSKVLDPIFENSSPPDLKAICVRYGVDNANRASNMIVTVKRRFQSLLKNQLKQFANSDSDIEQEFKDLVSILSNCNAVS